MPKHVLVVDDFSINAEMLAKQIALKHTGTFTAEAVFGGEDCLARLERAPKIDIVLLDIEMPVVSGADVIRRVLAKSPLPDLIIIPMTAHGEGWLSHKDMRALSATEPFKKIVHSTYDKGDGLLTNIVDQLPELAGQPSE